MLSKMTSSFAVVCHQCQWPASTLCVCSSVWSSAGGEGASRLTDCPSRSISTVCFRHHLQEQQTWVWGGVCGDCVALTNPKNCPCTWELGPQECEKFGFHELTSLCTETQPYLLRSEKRQYRFMCQMSAVHCMSSAWSHSPKPCTLLVTLNCL